MAHHVERGCSLTCAAILALLSSIHPVSAASTFAVGVAAGTVATVSVAVNGGGNVVCNPGAAVSGVIDCVNTVRASGNIRTTKGGSGSLTVAVAAVNETNGNILDPAALKMTCRDNGSAGRHGSATFAATAPSTPAGTVCASWLGPAAFTYDVNVSFGIDAARVDTGSYALSSGWTVIAAAT
jgi:hypothetical protein